MDVSKKIILEACIEKQNHLIENFQTRLETMKSDVFEYDQSPSQTDNRAAGKIELLNAVGKELDFALREMEILQMINSDKESSIVEPGAIVVTDKMTFFICVSVEQIEVEGNSIFGISTKAPIYAAMRGLSKESDFQFNETSYRIKEVR